MSEKPTMVRISRYLMENLVNILSCLRLRTISISLLPVGAMLTICAAQSVASDQKIVDQMQQMIMEQQKQLQYQAEQIRLQAERLDLLQHQLDVLKHAALPVERPATAVSETVVQQPAKAKSLTAFESADGRRRFVISGQINRAVNIIDDAKSINVYQIDNNVSNSRIRFLGEADLNDNISLGSRIEFAISPDVSSRVSQSNQSPGTIFDQRWVEVSVKSKSAGKLSLGKGDTASNTTSEIDLSGTDVIQYATVSDIAGGMLFREKDTKTLTTLTISDVFKSRDGLHRESRLRYDTPAFLGFNLAGSILSGQRSDIALFWRAETGGLKAAAAFAVANPKISDSGLQYNGSMSVFHVGTGLNLTLSGGVLKTNKGADPTNLYAKVGWRTSVAELGSTAFGFDYTRSENLPFSDDKAWSVGAAAVQAFNKIATELYIQYRLYELDKKSGLAVDSLKVGTAGVRVKF